MNTLMIFDFNKDAGLQNWYVVDDTVMGGESAGHMEMNNEGNGLFKGQVSLNNNGGFSSLMHNTGKTNLQPFSKFIIRLKGDGKAYQFRIKTQSSEYFSYIFTFTTNNAWQMIDIPFRKMYPSFRGRTLDLDNFRGDYLEQIGFLMGNKTEEDFKLEIAYISAQ